MSTPVPNDLSRYPIHLGLGASAVRQPDFTGDMDWYQAYGQRNSADGVEGRLVAMHAFTEDWGVWEMHPKGHEVVIVTAGALTLVQRIDGEDVETFLATGDAAINEPGTWHTAKCAEPVTALFITAGEGTEHADSPPA